MSRYSVSGVGECVLAIAATWFACLPAVAADLNRLDAGLWEHFDQCVRGRHVLACGRGGYELPLGGGRGGLGCSGARTDRCCPLFRRRAGGVRWRDLRGDHLPGYRPFEGAHRRPVHATRLRDRRGGVGQRRQVWRRRLGTFADQAVCAVARSPGRTVRMIDSPRCSERNLGGACVRSVAPVQREE